MRPLLKQRGAGMCVTSSQMWEPLQKKLIDQFINIHPKEREEAFLGHQEILSGQTEVSTTTKKFFISENKRELPLLWMNPGELGNRSVALQKWEGMVTNIGGNSFFARLKDLENESPEEEIEITLKDVSEDDKDLVQPGAIFYWSVGYETSSTGTTKRSSVIRFRRLPAWTASDLAEIKKKATEIRRAIGWGDDQSTATGTQ